MALRVSIVTAISFALAGYFVLARLPNERSHEWPLIGVGMMMSVIICLMGILARVSLRKIKYAISRDGMILPSNERPFVPWKRLDSFTVVPHPRLPGLAQLNLNIKAGFTRTVLLPESSSEVREIAVVLSRHLPERAPLQKHAPLTPAHWAVGLVFLLAACIGCAVIPIAIIPPWLINRHFMQYLPDLLLLFGPGTLAAMCLIGRRGFGQLVALALVNNLAGFLLISTIFVIRATLALNAK